MDTIAFRPGEIARWYLHAENTVLKQKFGKKRILLTDDQRPRLAVKGKLLERKQLEHPMIRSLTQETIARYRKHLAIDRDR